ncbi:MAG: hypothetical protein L0228_03555 [Planctomycetes bacterium]|nr:hypothetical protein [Planctomycetota bacterium]
MNQNRQQNLQDVLVFALLVAIGVSGRWGQPQWCFTPTAAAAIFAGFYFSRVTIASLVPIAILLIGDLLLPAYDSAPVMIVTYAALTLPVWFGRMLRNENRGRGTVWKLALCGLVPATVFFIVSNFAVWAFQSDYEKSLAGLAECYWAAVPFYRWMLAGDIFYVAVFTGCWLAASVAIGRERVRQ